MKSQICIILILGLALASQTHKLNTILAQVGEEPYGKAVGALIQMHTQDDTGRLNDINDFLEHLLTTLDEQDDAADAAWEQTQAYCSTTIPAKEKQLSELQAKLADLQQEKAELEQEQATKKTDLRDEENNLSDAKSSLADSEKQLETENTTFVQRQADFNEAIIACQEALRILKGMVHDPSVLQFVQIHSDFESLQKTFEKHHQQLGGQHQAYIQPIIDVLMQLASDSKANNHLNLERLKEVIKLIQMLLDRLKSQSALATTQHDTAVEGIQKLITDYNTAQRNAQTKIETLLGRLQDIAERLGAIDIDQLKSLIATTEETIKLVKAECDSEQIAYDSGKRQRANERALLEELIKYFKENVVGATQNVNDSNYQDNLGF